jgi:uncharacterized lipoprotein YmbA
MPRSKLILGIAVTVALVSFPGCGKIRYPNYYVLNVPAPSSTARTTPLLGPIGVRQFGSPRFLQEGPVVYRESPERLGFYAYDRWAADPRSAVTNAMIAEIRSRAAFVSVDPYDGGANCDWILNGTLDHLEEVDQGADVWIEVGVSARLKNIRSGEVLWQDTSAKRVKLDNRSVPGVVAAMSLETGSAVQSLVTSMLDRLSEAAPAESRGRE